MSSGQELGLLKLAERLNLLSLAENVSRPKPKKLGHLGCETRFPWTWGVTGLDERFHPLPHARRSRLSLPLVLQ